MSKQSDVGQNLVNSPSHDLKATKRSEKAADLKRSSSKSVLNLAYVNSLKKAAADIALKEINQNQAAWAEQLTQEDLKRFSRKVNDLQKDLKANKISGGITPNAIISRSRAIDIRRAEQEIHTVQAVRFQKDGVVVFRTNASRKHGATHHTVSVQFLNFQAALNAGKLTNAFLDDYMKSAVKFDCDCGRHRYWYRYVATVGGFAYGKPESAFPKIRNPELTGLACKHVVRVMHTLARNPSGLRQAIKQHIGRYRQDPNSTTKTLTKKQADKAKIIAKAGAKIRRQYERMEKEVQAAIRKKIDSLTPTQARREMAILTDQFSHGELSHDDFLKAQAALFSKMK